ncbi:MAG: hypothetical protein U0L67_07620 [Paludibacteraceae bacterium]|nr:hypothetical protein [Paludibacteraceae bacterium]
MGTEVVIVSEETVNGKVVAYVKLVDSYPELFYYTTKSNLTKIYTENFTCYAVKTDVPIYEIPFANSSKSNKFVVGKEYKFNYYCADYALLEGTKSQEKFSGVWVKYDDENIKRVYDLSKNPETKVIGNNALTKDDFVSSPYSTNKYSWGSSFNQDKFRAEKEIKVIASCGDYYLLEGTKGNQDFSGAWIKKDKLGCDIEEQKRLIHNALEEVIAAMGIKQQSCNLCTRKALYYLTGDPVLFPEKSEMKGLISGDGRASNIIADLESNSLSEYFDEIKKSDNETYDQYWKRLQDLADGGSVIVGTYKNNHVFLIVPGGLYDVVDNENHMDKNGYILEEYKDDPDISAGDRYGHSFAKSGRNHKRVNRILECGTNVKSDDAPVYAGMDWKGYKGSRFYKYKKPLRPIR